MPSNHLILCPSLLLPPSIFPSIRVFSSESVLHIRWPKYWSFSCNISPSNEYSGLISFRIDLIWSPCCPRDSQESFPTPQLRGSYITWYGGVGQGKRPQVLKILRQVSNQLLWIPLSCEERDLPPWCPWLLLYLSPPHPQMKPSRWC